MKPFFHVHALPELIPQESLDDGVAVVIDILRATTTMTHALHSGAKKVVPCLHVDDAFKLKATILKSSPDVKILLGGERNGTKVTGFDLGNSPEDYTPEEVAGKTVLFTTTNGTRALFRAISAQKVYLACFNNFSAVLKQLLSHDNVHVICAGTNQQYTEEDILFAGYLTDRIHLHSEGKYRLNTHAVAAREIWERHFSHEKRIGEELIHHEHLAQILRESRGGKNLMELGLGQDILAAAKVDRFDVVPVLNQRTMELTS